MNKETLSRISRVVGKVARADKLAVKTNLPVWDTTRTMTGVGLSCDIEFECDKKMGPVLCTATATFVLAAFEQVSEEKIRAKAELAAAALKAEILVSIKPKKKVVRAA